MTKWRGGSRPTGKCARGHKLVEGNIVKAGKDNNPRCKICRTRIYKAWRKRMKKKGKAK